MFLPRTTILLYSLSGWDVTCPIQLEPLGLELTPFASPIKYQVSNCTPSPAKVYLQLNIPLQICLNNSFLKRHCCSNVFLWWHVCFKSPYPMLLGSAVDKMLFLSLDDIKQEHKRRHRPSSVSDCVNVYVWILLTYISQYFQMNIKGSARFSLFGSTVVNTTIESQSSVTVDLKWNHVESVFETPPQSSSATMVITLKKQWATTVQSSTQFM